MNDNPALYSIARQITHEAGFDWTDPRTLKTYPAPKIDKAKRMPKSKATLKRNGTNSKRATRKTPKLVREYLRKIASRPRRTKGTPHARKVARNAALSRWQKEHPAPKPA